MLDAINSWFITIIDIVLSAWPSTPDGMKLSQLLAGPMADFPSAPWYLVGQFLVWGVFVLGAVAALKAFKLIWP